MFEEQSPTPQLNVASSVWGLLLKNGMVSQPAPHRAAGQLPLPELFRHTEVGVSECMFVGVWVYACMFCLVCIAKAHIHTSDAGTKTYSFYYADTSTHSLSQSHSHTNTHTPDLQRFEFSQQSLHDNELRYTPQRIIGTHFAFVGHRGDIMLVTDAGEVEVDYNIPDLADGISFWLDDGNGDQLWDSVFLTDGRQLYFVHEGDVGKQALQLSSKVVEAFTMGDLDGDGNSDIVFAVANHAVLFFVYGSGVRLFDPIQFDSDALTMPDGKSQIESIAVADVDGDGYGEVFQFCMNFRNIVLLKKNSADRDPALYVRSDVVLSIDPLSSPPMVSVGDVNGDGRDDVIVLFIHDKTTYLKVCMWDIGSQSLVCKAVWTYTPDDNDIVAHLNRMKFELASGDLDGDGDTDIVVTGTYNGLSLFESHGGATADMVSVPDVDFGSAYFTHTFQFDGRTSNDRVITSIAVADGDGDGDIDLLMEFGGFWVMKNEHIGEPLRR